MIKILQSRHVNHCVENLANSQTINRDLRLDADIFTQQSHQPSLIRGSLTSILATLFLSITTGSYANTRQTSEPRIDTSSNQTIMQSMRKVYCATAANQRQELVRQIAFIQWATDDSGFTILGPRPGAAAAKSFAKTIKQTWHKQSASDLIRLGRSMRSKVKLYRDANLTKLTSSFLRYVENKTISMEVFSKTTGKPLAEKKQLQHYFLAKSSINIRFLSHTQARIAAYMQSKNAPFVRINLLFYMHKVKDKWQPERIAQRFFKSMPVKTHLKLMTRRLGQPCT